MSYILLLYHNHHCLVYHCTIAHANYNESGVLTIPSRLSLSCKGGLISLKFFASNLEVNVTPGLSFFPGMGLPWLTAGRQYIDTRTTAKSGRENHSSALSKVCCYLDFSLIPDVLRKKYQKYQLHPTSHSTGLGCKL